MLYNIKKPKQATAVKTMRTVKLYTYLVLAYKATLLSWITRGDHYEEYLIKTDLNCEEFRKKLQAEGLQDPRNKNHYIMLITDVYDVTEGTL